MSSYWRSLALSILLLSATATTSGATDVSSSSTLGIDSYSIDGNGRTLPSVILSKKQYDDKLVVGDIEHDLILSKQQQQIVADDVEHDVNDKEQRRRNLAIAKNSLYQGAKAGKPKYTSSGSGGSSGGDSSSYPKSGKKAGGSDNTPVSTPIVEEGPVFGPTDVLITESEEGSTTTTEIKEEEITYEDGEVIEPQDDDILDEFFPEEEEEVHVPVHHGQNGGHTGPKPSSGGSKGGKASPTKPVPDDMSGIETSEELYVEHHGEETEGSSTALHHTSKTGKATLDHLIVKGNAGSAKSIKIPPTEEEEVVATHPPSKVDVQDSFKPKAEKKPLTEYFIKEPGASGVVKADSKSGKAASTKSAKKEVTWDGDGTGSWEPSWGNGGGEEHPSGKASKDPLTPPTSDDNDVNDVNDKPYWIYQDDKCTYFDTIPDNALVDGLELFMNKESCCTNHPDGCSDDDADIAPSDGEGETTVPVPSPSDGLLTMEPTSPLGSLVDVASGNEDFSTLVQAVDAAGLVDTLANEGPFTIFAPTNEAFAKLPEGALEELLSGEIEGDLEQLQDVLKYHVVSGLVPSSSLQVGTAPLTTLQGDIIQVTMDEDGNVMVNNANVGPVDVMAKNGIIHVIDAVLTPPPSDEDGNEDGDTTLSPTPSSNDDEFVDDEFDENAKYYPFQAEDGTLSCEFGADYPPDFPLFDTKEECCEFPPPPGEMYINCEGIEMVSPNVRNSDDEDNSPTYYPSADPDWEEPMLSTQGEEVVALEPFGLRMKVNSGYDEDKAKLVTQSHLTHSFRTQDWELTRMNLMVLEEDRRDLLSNDGKSSSRMLAEEHEVIFGGVLYFNNGVNVPTVDQMVDVVKASFEGERLEYYVDLLEEEGMDVESVKLDMSLQPKGYTNGNDGDSRSGFNWAGLTIGLSCSIVSLAILVFGSRYYTKYHRLKLDDLDFGDLEKGGNDYKDYAIRLQYTNDEIDNTIAETVSKDQLSLPSLVQATKDKLFATTPGGTNSYSSSKSGSGSGGSSGISPLESPQESTLGKSPGTSRTRYISVFTVKKDCGGKPLDQVDLRALAIAYLSRMLKKFPNTHLLPYDKTSGLPAITNIRNIPDDLQELQNYVGNARVDDKTGKVLFNLRVESDEPVSKMKGNTGSSSRFKAKKHTVAPLDSSSNKKPKARKESDDALEEEGDETVPPSPKSPGVMEDVAL